MAFAAILDPQLEQNLVSPWGAPQEGQTAALFGICWPHCLQYMVFTSLYNNMFVRFAHPVHRQSGSCVLQPFPRAFSTLSGVAGGSTHTPMALWMAIMTRWVLARLWEMPLAP